MEDPSRPGPRPKRLYARLVRWGATDRRLLPSASRIRSFDRELERVGRLVAHGELTDPRGDLLILRASSRSEVLRALRNDPYRATEDVDYELLDWNPRAFGGGVNLELSPQRGAGRLTSIQRVAIVIRDLGRAMQWYHEVLGFPIRIHDRETGYVELSLGRGASALSLVAPQRSWGEPYFSESVARIGQSTGIVFQTDSVEALALRLEHSGARVTQPPSTQPWGGRTLRFTDPDGNEFLAFEPGEARSRSRAVRAHPG